MRTDLEVTEIHSGAVRMWTVKDPVALRYYQLRGEEFAVLNLLNGRRTVDEVMDLFRRSFPDQSLSPEHLLAFVGQLAGQGLLVNNLGGQGRRLLDRRVNFERRQRVQRWMNPFGVRLFSIDPQQWLDRSEPYFRWMFRPLVQWTIAIFVVLTCIFMLANSATIHSRLPTAQAFLAGTNLVWMVLAYAAAKTLHELGHAVTCRHFGCECHEMGVMLLVFAPCLYCDVSDSWVLKQRWKRMAVSGAGIVVEVVLAAVCAWLWYGSEPGLFNSLMLNTVFVCTVSTFLFNANPLLRFDGYYLLSDWVGIPNLRQNAQRVAADLASRIVLGMRAVNDRLLAMRHRWFLAAYWILAIVYRVVVIGMLLWLLDSMLRPWGLRPLVAVMAAVLMFNLLAAPFRSVVGFIAVGFRHKQFRTARAVFMLTAIGLGIAAILFVPVRQELRAPFVIQPANSHLVHASVDGRLRAFPRPGQAVAAGEPLFELQNSALERQAVRLEAELNRVQAKLDGLEQLAIVDATASTQITPTRERRDDLLRRTRDLQQRLEQLSIRAPVDGFVLAARPRPESAAKHELPGWSGSLLEPSNIGCLIERETLLCQIGDLRQLEAFLLIDQEHIGWVRSGQHVRLFVVEESRTIEATVVEVALADVERVPVELLDDRTIPVNTMPDGTLEPLNTVYQVRVQLNEQPHRASTNSVGRARVQLPAMSLWSRLRRYLMNSFQSLI